MLADEGPGRLRALFRDREFLAYFFARQSGWLASSLEDVAIGWQVFGIRHRALDLGLVGLVLFLPQLLLALPAGVLADRWDRRSTCIAVACANALVSVAFAWLAWTHARSLPAYFFSIALLGISYAIGIPSQRAILASIVAGERFVRASALVSSVAQLITIAGPAIAGLLVAFDPVLAFAAAAFAQLLAAAAFSVLEPRTAESARQQTPSLWRSAVEGLRYIFARRIVLGAISLDLFAVLFGGATALLPVYATQILHVGALGFGLLRAAPAAGAAVVAAFVVRRPIRRNAGRTLLVCVAGFGAATIAFALSRNLAFSLAALALTGGFDMVSVVIRNALVQLKTPNEMRGRVGAVENVFIGASNELGAFESGTLAALIGTVPSVIAGGAATLVVIGLWTILFPELRTFDAIHDGEDF